MLPRKDKEPVKHPHDKPDSIYWKESGIRVYICPKCFELLDWDLNCVKCGVNYKKVIKSI